MIVHDRIIQTEVDEREVMPWVPTHLETLCQSVINRDANPGTHEDAHGTPGGRPHARRCWCHRRSSLCDEWGRQLPRHGLRCARRCNLAGAARDDFADEGCR